jgi:transcription elongation factor Elf1
MKSWWMEKMAQIIEKKPKVINTSINCGICSTEIKNRASIYHSGVYTRVICESCLKKFSTNEIELMVNLFTAFGGYFGKNKKPEYILYIILKELKEKSKFKENSFSLAEIKLQFLHKALLYGISPEKYFRGLKTIIY